MRGYIALGISTDATFDPPQTFNANRAFIQWAGFTFGRAQSYFDFFSQAAVGYLGFTPNSDTGDGGWEVVGYTAQLGNGFSATISAEDRRTTQIIGQGITPGNPTTFVNGVGVPGLSIAPNVGLINGGPGASPINTGLGYGGWQAPDIVGNLRVDQAWGSAQIGGAAHLVNAQYYINAPVGAFIPEESGNPGDKWGWAAMAGLRLNTPWLLNWFGSGAGDFFAVQGIYTEGAPRYIMQNPSNNNWWIQSGFNTAYGVVADGVYGGANFNGTGGALQNATGINLTTAWGLNASYEHFWTPQWRTSLYGGYTSVSYNSQANNILCSLQGSGTGVGSLALAQQGCDNNWTSWWVGSRTQWNVTKDFYMGLDVAYLKVDGMSTTSGLVSGTAITPNAATNATTFLKSVGDQDIWMARFRVHRDFYP